MKLCRAVGMLYAFLVFARRFSAQAQSLLVTLTEMYMLKLHLQRLADIVFQDEEKHLAQEYSRGSAEITGAIELRNLCFRYDGGEEDIFSDVNLRIRPGECVAISGPSGCGKSTLLGVMTGLLTPVRGQVLIDDIPLHRLGLRAFRSQTGVVMQNDSLLSGSLLDNICFFDQPIDMEKVTRVCRQARIWDDIARMPMGLNTLVGDMGSSLSGGQQQRLLLARALYREPRIIFMDEASSHLDFETERGINDFFRTLPITRVMIAHRQDTLDLADRVIDFERL